MALSVAFRGAQVPVAVAGQPDPSEALGHSILANWLASLDPSMDLRMLEFQSIDRFPDGTLWSIKFKSTVIRNGVAIPGICLLSGPRIGLLLQLRDSETGDVWVVLTRSLSVSTGRWALEIPTGRGDADGNVNGTAIDALRTEFGLAANVEQWVDLTELAYGEGGALFTGVGLSDEQMRIFLWNVIVEHGKLSEWIEKFQGVAEQTMAIVRFDDLWRTTADGKTLSAVALVMGLRDEGKLPV
jgi:ADP-sugar diphosphatase